MAGRPVDGRDVDDGLGALHQPMRRVAIAEVSLHETRSGRSDLGGHRRGSHQGGDVVATLPRDGAGDGRRCSRWRRSRPPSRSRSLRELCEETPVARPCCRRSRIASRRRGPPRDPSACAVARRAAGAASASASASTSPGSTSSPDWPVLDDVDDPSGAASHGRQTAGRGLDERDAERLEDRREGEDVGGPQVVLHRFDATGEGDPRPKAGLASPGRRARPRPTGPGPRPEPTSSRWAAGSPAATRANASTRVSRPFPRSSRPV